MMHSAPKLFLSLTLCFALGSSLGIGDRLVRTYLFYETLPITETDAINQGWISYSACDKNLGTPYTDSGYSTGPTKGYPVTLYYTGAGQLAGLGVEHFGAPVSGLETFFQPTENGTYRITLSFRSGGDLCGTQKYGESIGNQIVVDQGSLDLSIPLNETTAAAAKWTKGACLAEMGTHWSYDLKSAPTMSWKSANLLPVVTMYNEQAGGGISSVFITTPNLQYTEPLGPWEGPLPSMFMCDNWCSDDCSWDVSFWNTFHFFLDDRSLNTCPTAC